MAKVTVTNINVNVNNFQQAYTDLGLGPIPAGTKLDVAVPAIFAKLGTLLQTGWPANFGTYIASQEDSAIMSPWTANVGGTAPQCVIDAITLDFTSWALPVDSNTITLMAKEITQQIVNKGGDTGTFYGRTVLAGSEMMYWGVAFTTAIVVDSPEQTGILYAFTANLGIN
jgi:hypothetical protein